MRPPKVKIGWEKRWNEEGKQWAKLRWKSPQTGKRTSKALQYVTPEEAEQARGDLEASLRLGVDWRPASEAIATVGDVLERYLEELERRETSYGDTEVYLCRHLDQHIGRLPADRVNRETLNRYRGDRRRETTPQGHTPSSIGIKNELRALRAAYRVARECGLINCPPPELPLGRLPNDARPPRRLSEEEVQKLIEAGHRYQGRVHTGLGWLIQTLAWSGRRPVAVLTLTVQDCARLLDPQLPREQQVVQFRRDKGGTSRGWGPITEPARQALVARCREVGSGRLWRFDDGRSFSPVFRKVARTTNVDEPRVQAYDLRKFAVTQILAQCGGQARVAMAYTGHKTVTVLLRYAYDEVGLAEGLAGRIGWSPEPLRLVQE